MSTTSDPPGSLDAAASLDSVFAPVRSQTAFEEAVDRLGTAIRLGLLPPGHPAARRARALREAGDRALDAAPGAGRARAERPPARCPRTRRRHLRGRRAAAGRTAADGRDRPLARDLGPPRRGRGRRRGARLQARAPRGAWRRSGELLTAMEESLDDFGAYRQLDVRFHVGLAEATGNARLVTPATEVAGRCDRPDRADRAPARGARLLERPAPAAARRRRQR